jgi:hypothetical protein
MQVSLYHMDCMVNEAAREVTFLYKFLRGVASDSYGLHCAQAAGLPAAVVERAAQRKRDLESAGGGLKVSMSVRFAHTHTTTCLQPKPFPAFLPLPCVQIVCAGVCWYVVSLSLTLCLSLCLSLALSLSVMSMDIRTCQQPQEMRKLALFKSVARVGASSDGDRLLDSSEITALRQQVRLALADARAL